MQNILVLTTGGTIASHETEHGLAPGLADDILISYFQQLPNVTLSVESLMNKDSSNMQPEDWLYMAERLRQTEADYDGFIITHGTDTMAYATAGLSYLLTGFTKPVALTGSQIPLGQPTSDGVKNLQDALSFVTQTDLAGIYLVFDGNVIIGTRAIKTKTKSYDAFESINYPYVAKIVDGTLDMHHAPSFQPQVGDVPVTLDPNIFVMKAFPGMGTGIFDYLNEHIHGVIIESFGNGGLAFERRNILTGIEKLTANGIPVIITTQILEEGQEIDIYEVGQKVAAAGGITIGDMNTEAAVAKLMWILAETRDWATVKARMQTPIAHDLAPL